MATLEEPTAATHHRRLAQLLPLSPRVPSSTDRHFEQYLIDHHHFPKLPSIVKQSANRPSMANQGFLAAHMQTLPIDYEHHPGSINRLLNSEQYRRSHARLIEYRQHSKIPGVALKATTTNNFNELTSAGRKDSILPLKEVLNETARVKQYPNQEDVDFVDDDSIFSNDTDRRRRAKHWIKEHQFFFTEYQ